MQRISSIDPANATSRIKDLLNGVQTKLGMTPNLMKALATAPAALGKGSLDAKFREQIALTVAPANSCEYCLSAHSAMGKMVGLKPEEISASREGRGPDPKRSVGLRFGQTLVLKQGDVSDQTLADAKAAGCSEGEITEIVANVAMGIFSNYFNHVLRTEVDFPIVSANLQSTGQGQ